MQTDPGRYRYHQREECSRRISPIGRHRPRVGAEPLCGALLADAVAGGEEVDDLRALCLLPAEDRDGHAGALEAVDGF